MRRLQRLALLGLFAVMTVGMQPAVAQLPEKVEDGEELPSLAPLVDKVAPSVVNIYTKGTVSMDNHPLMQNPFFRRFFEEREMPERQTQSLGSGVIVDAEEGYVLTNHHVISQADQITAALNDGREFEAEVIGSDPETDIAVIQIPSEDLQEVALGNSDNLNPGDFVLAMGNPFGLDHTVTSGIVSGKGRSLGGRISDTRIQDFIQTDASINPGNSGGALVNLRGELVGVNTAILSRSGGNIGIGFAVPVNMAETVMNQLIEYGEVRRGMLGVRVQDLTRDIAQAMDMDNTSGALIAQVAPGSAADEAGLKQGDVVIAVNGETINDASGLAKNIGLREIGEEVTLKIVRDGKTMTLDAEVGEPPDSMASDGSAGGPGNELLEGIKLTNLDQRSELHGEVKGVLVAGVEQNAPASRYLQEGDVITSVNRQPVSNMEAFRQAASGAEKLLLHVRRGDSGLFVLIQ
jgi:Do/DeqQ family serine protease